jgi:flagellar biogenesis protein FliO
VALFFVALCTLANAPIAHAQVGPAIEGGVQNVQPSGADGSASNASSSFAAPEHARASDARPLGVPRTPVIGDASKPVGDSAPLASERSSSAFDRPAWSSLGPLVLVVTLIVLLGAGIRRFARGKGGLAMALGAGGRAPSGVVEVLARYPTGRGSLIVLMRVDRRVLVLHQSTTRRDGTRMSVLSELADSEDVASMLIKTRDEAGESIARSFDRMLGREASRHTDEIDPRSDGRTDRRIDRRNATRGTTVHATPAPIPAPATEQSSVARGASDAVRRRLEQMRAYGVRA